MNLNSYDNVINVKNLLTVVFTGISLVILSINGMAQGVRTQSADLGKNLATASACQCDLTTLMNTQANVKYASFPSNTDWNGTVTGAVEMPSSNTLQWNSPQRFNIDLQASKMRIEFARDATYGPGATFTFKLNPLAPATCGAAKIVGYSITTNRTDALSYINANSSFNSATNSVVIAFTNQSIYADWRKGDWIEAQLKFECQTTPTGPTPSTCCPPVDKLMVQGMFKHVGNAASSYLMPLDTTSAATSSFVNGLKSYLAYLQTICPQTAGLKADFFTGPVTAPTTVGGPAGSLSGTDASTPKSSAVINGSSNISTLNSSLTGMNTYSHNNNQYYRIVVKITGVTPAGQPVNCGFNAQECAIGDTFGFVYSPTAKTAGSPFTN